MYGCEYEKRVSDLSPSCPSSDKGTYMSHVRKPTIKQQNRLVLFFPINEVKRSTKERWGI
jgi:hypothetical protein